MTEDARPLRGKVSVLPGLRGAATPAGWIRVSDGFAELYWRFFSDGGWGSTSDDANMTGGPEAVYVSTWRVLSHISRVAQWVNNDKIDMLDASILKQPETQRHLLWNRSFNLIDGFVGSGIEDPRNGQFFDHAVSGKDGPPLLLDVSQWRKGLMKEGLSIGDPPGTRAQEFRAERAGREILNGQEHYPTKANLRCQIEGFTNETLGSEAWKRVWQTLAEDYPGLTKGGRPKKTKT